MTLAGSDPSNLFEDEKKTVADKYTQKVRHLLELKNKLSREEILLKEQRYLLGDNGHWISYIEWDGSAFNNANNFYEL